jgi:peptide deformylase
MIVTWPDERLSQVAAPVEPGERVREIVDAMWAALDASADGIGLAAPQIGVMKRIIVARVLLKHFGHTTVVKHVIVNPVLTLHYDKGPMTLGWEGCLSFPGKQVQVPRWQRIQVTGQDQRGNHHVVGAKGLMARVLQHEIDHLNGRNLAYYARVAYEIDEAKKGEQQLELPFDGSPGHNGVLNEAKGNV